MSPPPPIFYCSIRRKVIKFSKFPAAAVHWHHELSYLHKELLESRGTLFLSQMYLFFCDNRLCRLDLIELVCHSTLWQFMISRWKFLAKLHTFLVHCSLLWRESHLVVWPDCALCVLVSILNISMPIVYRVIFSFSFFPLLFSSATLFMWFNSIF